MVNHPNRSKHGRPATLERAVAFTNHGEELLAACKALLADIEAGYGSADAIPASVKGVRLLGKVMGDIRRAKDVIAKIEPVA
jgi:hypothetical protein